MTSLDARYKAALPEFPLFELDFGQDDAAPAAAPAEPVSEAPQVVGPPALIDVDAVEIDATPVVDEAEAALLDAATAAAAVEAEKAAAALLEVATEAPASDAVVVEPATLPDGSPAASVVAPPAPAEAVAVAAAAPTGEDAVDAAPMALLAPAPDPSSGVPGIPAWAGAVGVFDLETTGIDTDTARIVSASVAVLDECGVVVERKDWLIDPGVEIPDGASAVHGISTERARRYGRPAPEVVAEILAAIRSVERRGIPLVVYNAPYDLTLLAREAERHGHEPLDGTGHVIDPLVLDKALDRYRRGKRTLEVTAAVYGVELTDAHDAAADAIAAGRLAQAMATRYAADLDVELHHLHAMQTQWCREQAQRFEDYMRRTKDPSFTANPAWPCR